MRQLITAFGSQLDLNKGEGRSGYTALHIAIESRKDGLIDLLLSAEIQPKLQLETCTYRRRTAHQLAAMLGDRRTTQRLEKCGAQPLEPESSDDEEYDEDTSDEEDDIVEMDNVHVSNDFAGVALAVWELL